MLGIGQDELPGPDDAVSINIFAIFYVKYPHQLPVVYHRPPGGSPMYNLFGDVPLIRAAF